MNVNLAWKRRFVTSIIATLQRKGKAARDADSVAFWSLEKEVYRYAASMFDADFADAAARAAMHGDPIDREWVAARHRA